MPRDEDEHLESMERTAYTDSESDSKSSSGSESQEEDEQEENEDERDEEIEDRQRMRSRRSSPRRDISSLTLSLSTPLPQDPSSSSVQPQASISASSLRQQPPPPSNHLPSSTTTNDYLRPHSTTQGSTQAPPSVQQPSKSANKQRWQPTCSVCHEVGHTSRNPNCRRRLELLKNQERETETKRQREKQELEKRGREAARQRTLQRIETRMWEEENGEDEVPPSVEEALAGSQQRPRLAEGELRRMEQTGDFSTVGHVGMVEVFLATSRLQSEREGNERQEREFAQARAAMEERWAANEAQMEISRERTRRENEGMRRQGESQSRRFRVVTEDVLAMILLQYRSEGLSLSQNQDPTFDPDPLYPYLNWNRRAKDIVWEVVIEKKGEFRKQVVKEVEELEQQLMLSEDERLR